MLSEQALGQRIISGQLMQCFKSAVHPHCHRNGSVPDAVAGPGIAGAYSAYRVLGVAAKWVPSIALERVPALNAY